VKYRQIAVKKKIKTKFGPIHVSNSQPFSVLPAGFGISPYLQEKLLYLGQEGTYQEASVTVKYLLDLQISPVQIYRLTHHYGQAIEADLNSEVVAATGIDKESIKTQEVIYAMVDGAMILTDAGYKENKLGRIFSNKSMKVSVVEDRGGSIESSLYTSHLGTSDDFIAKIKGHMNVHKSLSDNLVFISDGAVWLRHMVEQNYPQATMILDFYHAMEYIGTLAVAAFGKGRKASNWIENQRLLLLNSELDVVLTHVKKLKVDRHLSKLTYNYLDSNRDRMDYKTYRKRNLLIGSGAIESSHRTVVQKRCKRSGQRWSLLGAQRVLNLRVCWMSKRWDIVRQHIEPYEQIAA
jgi:hypothetical protein